jgi:hypothetical protein
MKSWLKSSHIHNIMDARTAHECERSLGEAEASRSLTESGDEVVLFSDLGLDVIREVVGVVAGEHLAARHGGLRVGRVHLLDVGLVVGINDGRDVEVGGATPARELDLTEHTGLVLLTISDGVEVADILIRELNSGLLGVAHSDRVHDVRVLVGSEVDGALDIIKSPEGDGRSVGESGRASKSKDRGGEMHLEEC